MIGAESNIYFMSEHSEQQHWTGKERRHKRSLVIFLGIFAVLFVFVCALFVREYLLLRHSGLLRPHAPYQTREASPRLISNIEKIESWMTFDYLSASFGIPTEVLRERLHIMNDHYPRMSIRRAARERGIPPEEYLAQVKKIIQEYLLSKNIP